MPKSSEIEGLIVDRIYDAPAGSVRRIQNTPGGHPADGMTATVALGGGAYATIIDPTCFDDGGPEWVMRYGNPESIRYAVASLLATFDYILSSNITASEADRRIRLMRNARAALSARPRP